jgi:hypothetical protein
MSSNAAPDFVSPPSASSYRLDPSAIDRSRCVGRVWKDGVDDDKRWKPAVYRERQCGRKMVDDSDLCTTCLKRYKKASGEDAMLGTVAWLGRVTEDPPAWCHMLGTAWAVKCKWVGDVDTTKTETISVKGKDGSVLLVMNKPKKKAAKKTTPLPPPEPESPTPVPDPRDIEIARLTAEVVRLQAVIALIHNATTPVP